MKGRWNLSHPFTEHCKQQEDDDTIMNQLPDSVMKPVKVQKALFFKDEKCIQTCCCFAVKTIFQIHAKLN